MKKFYCPVNGWDCPSWRDEDGSCKLVDKGKDPTLECSDAFIFWEEDAGNGCYFVEEERQGEIQQVMENLKNSPYYDERRKT